MRKSDEIKFTIPGKPIPLARVRASGKSKTFYIPQHSKEFQKKVKIYAYNAGLRKTRKNIYLKAVFYRADKRRCDIDNLLKNLLDGLRSFFNDAQVIALEATKLLCESEEEERTEVIIRKKDKIVPVKKKKKKKAKNEESKNDKQMENNN